ncbi:MAG: DUF4124 domain-containing protein [Burkholderiaceae bacterium]|nr:DUF4124 domain-containing protein [Burkholderiaceae bacterium]
MLTWCNVQAAAPIYSCTDSNGKRLTSDRPIPECTAREQRVLNADGSTRKVVPPTMTADEQAESDARERVKASRRAAEQDAIRRDRNLRMRYPTEAAHQKARLAALDDLDRTLKVSQKRLEALAAERKPLLDEAEFYVGRQLPARLKQQLDGNDAAAEAQRALMQNQQSETQRINASFDAELVRLRALWAGAAPGSLGMLAPAPAPAPRLSPVSSSTDR